MSQIGVPVLERRDIPVSKIMPMMDFCLKLHALYNSTYRNPRVQFDAEQIQFLGHDMLRRGQLVPCLVMDLPEPIKRDNPSYEVGMVDGERRRRGALAVNLQSLSCEVIGDRTTPKELHEIMFEIERHKEPWTDVEKGFALVNYIDELMLADKIGDPTKAWQSSPKIRSHYIRRAAEAYNVDDSEVRRWIGRFRNIFGKSQEMKHAIKTADVPGGISYFALSVIDRIAKQYDLVEAQTRGLIHYVAKNKPTPMEWKVLQSVVLPQRPKVANVKELFALAKKEAEGYKRLDIVVRADILNGAKKRARKTGKSLTELVQTALEEVI